MEWAESVIIFFLQGGKDNGSIGKGKLFYADRLTVQVIMLPSL